MKSPVLNSPIRHPKPSPAFVLNSEQFEEVELNDLKLSIQEKSDVDANGEVLELKIFQNLMRFLSSKYPASNPVTMKFLDTNLEDGFLRNHQQYLQELGIIYVVEVAMVACIYVGFLIHEKYYDKWNPKGFVEALILNIAFIILPLFHLLLTKKFLLAST